MDAIQPETLDTGEPMKPETEQDTGSEPDDYPDEEPEDYNEDTGNEPEKEPMVMFAGQKMTLKQAEQAYMDANRRANEAERTRQERQAAQPVQQQPSERDIVAREEFDTLIEEYYVNNGFEPDDQTMTRLANLAYKKADRFLSRVHDVADRYSPDRKEFEDACRFVGQDPSEFKTKPERDAVMKYVRKLQDKASNYQPSNPQRPQQFTPRGNKRDAMRGGRTNRAPRDAGLTHIPAHELKQLKEAGMSMDTIKAIDAKRGGRR